MTGKVDAETLFYHNEQAFDGKVVRQRAGLDLEKLGKLDLNQTISIDSSQIDSILSSFKSKNRMRTEDISSRIFGDSIAEKYTMKPTHLLALHGALSGLEIPNELSKKLFAPTEITDDIKSDLYDLCRKQPDLSSSELFISKTQEAARATDEIVPGNKFYDLVTDPNNSPENIARLLVDFSQKYKKADDVLSSSLDTLKAEFKTACDTYPNFKERFERVGNALEKIEGKHESKGFEAIFNNIGSTIARAYNHITGRTRSFEKQFGDDKSEPTKTAIPKGFGAKKTSEAWKSITTALPTKTSSGRGI